MRLEAVLESQVPVAHPAGPGRDIAYLADDGGGFVDPGDERCGGGHLPLLRFFNECIHRAIRPPLFDGPAAIHAPARDDDAFHEIGFMIILWFEDLRPLLEACLESLGGLSWNDGVLAPHTMRARIELTYAGVFGTNGLECVRSVRGQL